jgi:hypothetical protein
MHEDSTCVESFKEFVGLSLSSEYAYTYDPEHHTEANPCNPEYGTEFTTLYECVAFADANPATETCANYAPVTYDPIFTCSMLCAQTFAQLLQNCAKTIDTFRGPNNNMTINDLDFVQVGMVVAECSAEVSTATMVPVSDSHGVHGLSIVVTSNPQVHGVLTVIAAGEFSPAPLVVALLGRYNSSVVILHSALDMSRCDMYGICRDSEVATVVHFVVDVATSQQKVHVLETLNETCWVGLTGSNAVAELDAPASVRTLVLEPPSVHCIVDRLEFSMTVCHGPEGHLCEYACDSGYVAEGEHVCSGEGHFGGGRCVLKIVDAPVVTTTMTLAGPAVSPVSLAAALKIEYGDKTKVLNYKQQSRLSLSLPISPQFFVDTAATVEELSPLEEPDIRARAVESGLLQEQIDDALRAYPTSIGLVNLIISHEGAVGAAIGYTVRKSAAQAASTTDETITADNVAIESAAKYGNRRLAEGQSFHGTQVGLLVESSTDVSSMVSATDAFQATFAVIFNNMDHADLPEDIRNATIATWRALTSVLHTDNMTATAPTFTQSFDVEIVADPSSDGSSCHGSERVTKELGNYVMGQFFCPNCLAADSSLLSIDAEFTAADFVSRMYDMTTYTESCQSQLKGQLRDPGRIQSLFAAAGIDVAPDAVVVDAPSVECGNSLVENAEQICIKATLGVVCNYTCQSGYSRVGDRTCELAANGARYEGGSCVSTASAGTTDAPSLEDSTSFPAAALAAIIAGGAVLLILVAVAVLLRVKKARASAAVGIEENSLKGV